MRGTIEAMKETGEHRKGSHAGVLLAAVLLLSPVLYILSIGPAFWLASHGYLSQHTIETISPFYAPIEWLMKYSDTASEAIAWYIDFWR
jgi:hypothetical protein